MRLKFHKPLPPSSSPSHNCQQKFRTAEVAEKKVAKVLAVFRVVGLFLGDRRSRCWLDEVVDSIADIVQKLNIFAACSL